MAVAFLSAALAVPVAFPLWEEEGAPAVLAAVLAALAFLVVRSFNPPVLNEAGPRWRGREVKRETRRTHGRDTFRATSDEQTQALLQKSAHLSIDFRRFL